MYSQAAPRISPRRVLLFASVTHVWNDAFFALIVPLLPFIAEDLGLSYTQSGLLRTVFSGASGLLQIPSGYLAEAWGEFWLIIGGNLWVAGGLIAMGAAPTYAALLVTAFVGGLGGGTQHPLGTSMVSRAYDRQGSFTAIGAVNFAGDLGKMAGPALAAVAVVVLGWRSTFVLVGVAGLIFMAAAIAFKRYVSLPPARQDRPVAADDDTPDSPARAFAALGGVGMLDAATRGAALTFLPFVLADKGLGAAQVSGLFVLVFAGGALGKIALGWLGDRVGALGLIWSSKGMTALLLAAFLPLPVPAIIPLLVLFGFGLNGTSSVLYASVAKMVSASQRARRYGVFYTATEVATALAPAAYGLVADAAGLPTTMTAMAVATAAILPASLTLKRYL